MLDALPRELVSEFRTQALVGYELGAPRDVERALVIGTRKRVHCVGSIAAQIGLFR